MGIQSTKRQREEDSGERDTVVGIVGKVAGESRRGGGDTSNGGRRTLDNGEREEQQWQVYKHIDNTGRRQT